MSEKPIPQNLLLGVYCAFSHFAGKPLVALDVAEEGDREVLTATAKLLLKYADRARVLADVPRLAEVKPDIIKLADRIENELRLSGGLDLEELRA